MATTNKSKAIQETIEGILRAIIDDWYERVSGYYITSSEETGADDSVELKRIHDEKGHLIKFNKDGLDFTYGLRSTWDGDHFLIEISVNNKVENFAYDDFRNQLFAHYEKAGSAPVQRPALGSLPHRDVFQLESGFSEAFTVEKRMPKADIMRLSFRVNADLLDLLAADPEATKQLIEAYCVSPFRSIYAKVYRNNPS